jgi:uncharacterized membrane protein YeaQ/YmgE (transglycosylase-associated protein family)
MGILSWVLFGLIAGAIAKLLMLGEDPGGWIVAMFLGISGAVVGGFVGTLWGFGSVSGSNVASPVVAVIGAMLLLLIYRVVARAV